MLISTIKFKDNKTYKQKTLSSFFLHLDIRVFSYVNQNSLYLQENRELARRGFILRFSVPSNELMPNLHQQSAQGSLPR